MDDIRPVDVVVKRIPSLVSDHSQPIYLDHHATTPVDPRVANVFMHAMTGAFGNANNIDHNPALRLQKHKEGCLFFLTDPRTPFTNNDTVHDLRMAKQRQNISGSFRSEQGACNLAILRTAIATASKQGWNILNTLAYLDPMQLIPRLRL